MPCWTSINFCDSLFSFCIESLVHSLKVIPYTYALILFFFLTLSGISHIFCTNEMKCMHKVSHLVGCYVGFLQGHAFCWNHNATYISIIMLSALHWNTRVIPDHNAATLCTAMFHLRCIILASISFILRTRHFQWMNEWMSEWVDQRMSSKWNSYQ